MCHLDEMTFQTVYRSTPAWSERRSATLIGMPSKDSWESERHCFITVNLKDPAPKMVCFRRFGAVLQLVVLWKL